MTKLIKLYSRSQHNLFAVVDDADYDDLYPYRWRLNSKGYAIRSFVVDDREVVVAMHRQIMKPPPDLVVDHINGQRLENTRSNLRILTQQQNLMNRRRFRNNSSGLTGVTYQDKRWRARIEYNGQQLHLGFYRNFKVAGLIYDCAAVLLYGAEIVRRNYPDEPFPMGFDIHVRELLRKQGIEAGR